MHDRRVLVAGVGNIFLGDDAFGVEVAQRLSRRELPAHVAVVDFGIRGLDLAYSLLEPYDAIIIVDAMPRGDRPGTLYVIEPEPVAVATTAGQGSAEDAKAMAGFEPHGLDPAKVLRLAASLGARTRRVLFVGCEPTPVADPEEMQMELSPAVRAAVDEAVVLVRALVDKVTTDEGCAGHQESPTEQASHCVEGG